MGQAAAADGTSPEVAYRHARALEDLELRDGAILEFCRAMALGAVDAGIQDSRARLDALYEIVRERITDRARGGFVSGLRETDQGLYGDASCSFSVAIEEVPDWAEAYYNRAIVYERLGRIQESLADYRRYLMLSPSEIDPVVAMVAERIGMLEGAVASPTPSPGAALVFAELLGDGLPSEGPKISVRSIAQINITTGTIHRHAVEAETQMATRARRTRKGIATGVVGDDGAVLLRSEVVHPGGGSVRACDDVLAGRIVEVSVFHRELWLSPLETTMQAGRQDPKGPRERCPRNQGSTKLHGVRSAPPRQAAPPRSPLESTLARIL
jgi:tetratricopeptide (TPR) repeat protein